MGVTAAAGTLLLAERGYLTEGRNLGIAVFIFALAAGVAFVGQDALVDHLTDGRSIERNVKLARTVASGLIGLGGGVLLAIVFS